MAAFVLSVFGIAECGDEGIAVSQDGGADVVDHDVGVETCRHPEVVARCKDGFCEIPAGCFTMGSSDREIGHPAYAEQQREVTLTRPFILAQYETSIEEWVRVGFVNRNGPLDATGTGDCLEPSCPIARLTWYEAILFANAVSRANGLPECYRLDKCHGTYHQQIVFGPTCDVVEPLSNPYQCEGYRLPTSAEWEYAARAGTTTAFYNGPIALGATIGDCTKDPNLELIGWYCANSGRSRTQKGVKPRTTGVSTTCSGTRRNGCCRPTSPAQDPMRRLTRG